ncbi:MAG: DUF2092 domain-containing protein, partial [Verrucomicrobiales bacterium]|nr:DUF2092 domain-containing protein [Verrucomicrobiales bacterium]
QGEAVDWQAWVKDGAEPTIKKIVLTFKEEQGRPQFIALFRDWDTATVLPAYVFSLDSSNGLLKIEVLPNEKETKKEAASAK